MARIGLVGGSYTSQSRNADDQLTMNLYSESIESGSGKVASALYSTPGTIPFMGLDDTPVRGQIISSGRAFAIGGSIFSEQLSNGTKINYGIVANDGNPASMAAGPNQILIASAGQAYVFDISTGIIVSSNLNAGGDSGIASSSIGFGGVGYTAGDTFLVSSGDANATGVVDTVSSGAVLTYHLTSVGSGYLVSSGSATTAQTGAGMGFTLNILTIGGGYQVNDTGTINGGAVLAQYQILSTDANGNVLTYSITSPGSGYMMLVGLGTMTGGLQPGIGVGFAVNITSVGISNTFAPIPQATLANVNQVGFCDGFFLACIEGSETFQASALEDATSWNPLSVATISVFVDTVQTLLVDHRQVWLFGMQKSCVYYNSGNFPFPFDLVPGAFIEQGIAAKNSAVQLDNSVFWIGGDQRGQGIAWRANGYTPTRISNHAVEYAWQGYSTISDAIGYSYQDQGHSFWVIYFPTVSKTWVYDVATQQWHERGYWNAESGLFTAHRSQNHIFAFGKHLVGDWMSGNINEMNIAFYSDLGNPIRRVRRVPHIASEQEWIFHHQLQVDMETGLGPIPPLTGNFDAPYYAILEDSFGAFWTLTIADSGNLQVQLGSPYESNPVGQFFPINDNAVSGVTWQVNVNGNIASPDYGKLTTTQIQYNSDYPQAYPMATIPSGLQNAIFVGNGLLQTNISLSAARDPIICLRWSDDGGHTWSNEHDAGAGQAGRFRVRVMYRRLGRSRDRVYELSMSDPIAWRLLEDDLKATPGFSESERIVSQYRKVS